MKMVRKKEGSRGLVKTGTLYYFTARFFLIEFMCDKCVFIVQGGHVKTLRLYHKFKLILYFRYYLS